MPNVMTKDIGQGLFPALLRSALLADAESLGWRHPSRVVAMADDEDMEVEKDTGGDSKQRFVVKKWCVHACWSLSRPSCEGASAVELAACTA